jgi:outer membrane protein insertion porin family
LRYELSSLLVQQPNDKAFLFFKPRLWYFYRTMNKGDTTDFDRFIIRNIAEPPSLYDRALSLQTADRMKSFLFERGYFRADVRFSDITEDQEVRVTYNVKPGPVYVIDTFEFHGRNPELLSAVNRSISETFLVKGLPVSSQLINLEKSRLTQDLQNAGYETFNAAYFRVQAIDTSGAKVYLRIEILPRGQGELHRPKTIGNVQVIITPSEPETALSKPDTTQLNSIVFVNYATKNAVKPGSLLKFIHLKPDSLYQKDAVQLTRQQLRLPTFRFVTVESNERSAQTDTLDFSVVLQPGKRIDTEYDFEVNYTKLESLSFFGVSGGVNLTNYNFLRGAERLASSFDASLELNPFKGSDRFFNSINLNFNNGIELPKFTDYLGTYKFAKRIGIVSEENRERLIESGRSLFNLRYEYVDIFRWYNYHSFNVGYGFNLTTTNLGRRKKITVTHPSVTYFNPATREEFNRVFAGRTFAQRSFAPQLFTSLFFNNIDYRMETGQNSLGIAHALLANLEISGLEAFVISKISGRKNPFKLGELSFAEYARFDLDGRLYKTFGQEHQLAFRANIGIATSFRDTTLVPYVKQFYLGGPISIRAWKIRELGPGAFRDTSISRSDVLPFFEAGDIKLLLNAEYRFDIFWRFEGALFLDAGNIWSMKEDEREGGQISKNFIDQIAVGSGFGLRFDATYFKVVFDLGVKLRNPFPDETGSHWALRNDVPRSEVLNLNFAINYPF